MNRTEPKSPAKTWMLHDSERPLERVDSSEDLERMVRDLPNSGTTPNRIVELESPEGDRLSFGIASSRDGDNPGLTQAMGCIQFTGSSLEPPYLVPVGDGTLTYETGGVV